MKLSFVVPSYNSAAWLSQAVQSCLEQTHRDIEVIVVDDYSTDSTAEYLDWQQKADPRVRYLINAENMGRSISRNLGNQMATGEVICVLDADDLALPNRARIVAEKFGAGCQFLYGSAIQIDACGRGLGELPADVFNAEKAQETLQNRIVHSTVAYCRDLALKYPYLDGDVSRLGVDDWAMQTECYLNGVKMEFVPNILSAYRILQSAISQTRSEEEVKKFKKSHLEQLRAIA